MIICSLLVFYSKKKSLPTPSTLRYSGPIGQGTLQSMDESFHWTYLEGGNRMGGQLESVNGVNQPTDLLTIFKPHPLWNSDEEYSVSLLLDETRDHDTMLLEGNPI